MGQVCESKKNIQKEQPQPQAQTIQQIKIEQLPLKDIDSEKITNSNQIALSLIDKIEKNNSFENTLKTIEQNIKNNSLVQQGIELYEYCYNSLYNNLNIEQDQYDKNKDKEKEKEGQNKKNKKHQKFKNWI